MDEATYKAWWPLHIRAAQGRPLTPEERTFYETTKAAWDAAEAIGGPYDAEIRTALALIADQEQERALLREERHQLEARIASLEAALSARVEAAAHQGAS